MDLAALSIFAVALFVAAVSPGPGVAAIVGRVLGRGMRGALPFTAGIAFGDVLWLSAAIGGLAVLAQHFHGLFVAVKWAGVAYLVFLAWKMWRAPGGAMHVDAVDRSEHPVLLFAAGLAVTLGNPKTMVFYLALLPNILDLQAITLHGYVELVLVCQAILAVVFGFYIVLAARARHFLATPKSRRFVNRLSAGAMAGAATWIATR